MRRRIPCTTSAPNESRRAEFSLPGIAAVTNAQIRLGRGGARYRDHVAVCTYVGYILCRRPIASGALARRDEAAGCQGASRFRRGSMLPNYTYFIRVWADRTEKQSAWQPSVLVLGESKEKKSLRERNVFVDVLFTRYEKVDTMFPEAAGWKGNACSCRGPRQKA